MAEPAVKTEDDSETDAPEEPDEPEESTEDQSPDEPLDDDDVDMVSTNIEETGTDPDGFFDGVETDTSNAGADEAIFDGLDDGGSGGSSNTNETPEADETRSSGLAKDINQGVARAAVIGLDDEFDADGETKTKTDLQKEFEETFEAFRLGHYGSKVAEEYLLMEAEDIHPVWGLLGAALICAAVIIYKRPDGGELVDSAKMKVGQADLSRFKNAGSEDDD